MKKHLSLTLLLLFLFPQTIFALKAKTTKEQVDNSVQFEGIVEPGQVYVFVLGPGETIASFHIEKDQKVFIGDPLLTLTNERLFSLYGETIERKVNSLKLQNSVEKLKIVHQSLKERRETLSETLTKMDRLASKGFDVSINDRILSLKEKYHDLTREIQLTQKEIELQEGLNDLYIPVHENNDQMAQSLSDRIADLNVKSNINGDIKSIHSEPNRAIPGDKVLEIWDTSSIKIRASVSQNHVEYLQVGDEVNIYFDFFSDKSDLGKVVEIGDGRMEMNSGGQRRTTFPVLIEPLKNKDVRIGNEVIIKMNID